VSTTLNSDIDYGDIPSNMDEQAMRKYLDMESNLVMPGAKKKDSFEAEWTSERQKLNSNQSLDSNRLVFTNKQSSTNLMSDANGQISRLSTATDYSTVHNPNMDRMSTVTFVSNASGVPLNKREHSFQKQSIHPNMYHTHYNQHKMPTIADSGPKQAGMLSSDQSSEHQKPFVPPSPPPEWSSGLTKQVAPQKSQLVSQANQQGGVIQSRSPEGLIVVKQLPFRRDHVKVHVYVEISAQHVEHIVVHFNKTLTVEQFIDMLKHQTNNGAFKDNELEIFCADEDGDLDDDFPAPDPGQVIKSLGLEHFYIKIKNADDAARSEMRRSTIRHKKGLQSTATTDSMYSLSEEESEDESSDGEHTTSCNCTVM